MEKELEELVKNYIKDNLRLYVNEERYGYNGKHIKFKLILGEEILSEEYIDVERDDG